MQLEEPTPRFQSAPVASGKALVSFVLALLAFATASAQTVTLLNDTFTNAVRVGVTNNWTGVDRDGGTSVNYGADLPFIVGRLSTGQTSLNDTPAEAIQFNLVRDAQTAVAAAVPRVSLVNTDAYGMNGDNLHFNAAGQQSLGKDSGGALFSYVPFTSPPTLKRLGNGDMQVTVANAYPGWLYTLQNSGTLLSGGWVNGDAEISADTTLVLTYTPGVGETRRLFRVTRSPAP
jgi:hypothetical protein